MFSVSLRRLELGAGGVISVRESIVAISADDRLVGQISYRDVIRALV